MLTISREQPIDLAKINNGFNLTEYSMTELGAQTDHHGNYCSLLLMHKKDFFSDPW